MDIFASEYGFTPDYVLWTLTRQEVEALLRAIARRHKIMADAMKKGRTGDEISADDLTKLPPAELQKLGIPIARR